MATDEEIRQAGFKYIPQQKYLQNPFELPENQTPDTSSQAPVVNQGIVNTGSFNNAISPYSDLAANFNTAINARQNRLENPDKLASFLSEKFGIGGQRSVDQMIRDATAYNMSQLGAGVNSQIIPQNNNMTGPEINEAIAEYAGDETSIGNYPVDDPRDVRKDLPFGLTGILSAISPSSYYDKMTMPEQIYTQSQMGYTGPTVFGENNTGGSKDYFGRNVVSAFGNYAEKQAKDIQKLDDLFGSENFAKKYGADTELTFNEETGQFEFTGTNAAKVARANKMNRLNLLRYNFDKQGLKKLDDIKDQTGFTDIMEADNKGTTDYGITSGISDDSYRSASETRRRSDQQDVGAGLGGSTFDYNDPYDEGGGE
jgi:hypothetical protein